MTSETDDGRRDMTARIFVHRDVQGGVHFSLRMVKTSTTISELMNEMCVLVRREFIVPGKQHDLIAGESGLTPGQRMLLAAKAQKRGWELVTHDS